MAISQIHWGGFHRDSKLPGILIDKEDRIPMRSRLPQSFAAPAANYHPSNYSKPYLCRVTSPLKLVNLITLAQCRGCVPSVGFLLKLVSLQMPSLQLSCARMGKPVATSTLKMTLKTVAGIQ